MGFPSASRSAAVALSVAVCVTTPYVVHADPTASLNDRAQAAAESARPTGAPAPATTPGQLTAVSAAQANALMKYLLPLRVSNKYLGRNVGIATYDTETGTDVFSRQPNQAMLPASNMKIVTALAALHTMGPGRRFSTTVLAPSRGTLVLKGGGDTLLTSDGLGQLARQTADYLRSNSQAKKPVKVYVDDTLFGTPKRGPGWTDSYQPYVVRPVRSLGRIGIYTWDSASDAASVFVSALRNNGVKATVSGRRTAAAGSPRAGILKSQTLGQQLRYMLLVSENNIAEMMFRHTALATGFPPTWKGSRLALEKVLTDLGLSTTNLRLKDGSGVSRADRLTPQFLVNLLKLGLDTKNHPQFANFVKSLPVSGRSGTLAASNGRYTTEPSKCAAGKVSAKTGTLFDTVGLSGYTTGQDGAIKIFSVLVNDRPQAYSPLSTRRAVDGLVATMTGCWGPSKGEGTPSPTASSTPKPTSSPKPSASPSGTTRPSPTTSPSVSAVPLP